MNKKEMDNKSEIYPKCFLIFRDTFGCEDENIFEKSFLTYGLYVRSDAEELVKAFNKKECYYCREEGLLFNKSILDENGIKPNKSVIIITNKHWVGHINI